MPSINKGETCPQPMCFITSEKALDTAQTQVLEPPYVKHQVDSYTDPPNSYLAALKTVSK